MADSGIFVYVSCAGSGEVRVLRMDASNGKLTPVQELPVGGKAAAMAISPDRRFLHVAVRTQPYRVASCAIDPLSGTLTYLGDAPLPGNALYLSVDRTGRFLFATSIPESKTRRTSVLTVSPIGPHGFVQPPQQSLRAEPKIHSIVPDPTNRYVFAASCIGEVVLGYTFDQATGMLGTNALAPVRVKPKAGPRHMAFHPNNRLMYLLNETDATVYVFGYDAASGRLAELQIVDAAPPGVGDEEPMGADVHLTHDGKFFYASVRASSTLAAFSVDARSGLLTLLEHYATEKQPRSFSIDPYGRYLFAAGQFSHGMSGYEIDRESGRLKKIGEYAMGKAPNWVEIVRLP